MRIGVIFQPSENERNREKTEDITVPVNLGRIAKFFCVCDYYYSYYYYYIPKKRRLRIRIKL